METTNHWVERKIGEPVLRFETGRLAQQADGATLARVGDTTVLVAATVSAMPREGLDFFPLTVDVEERVYAAGKIPGSVIRREGRPSERAILTDRLIDRPLRPCFPDGFRNEVHIVPIVSSVDFINPPDVLAINGSSMALMLSGIPFDGPVGAVRLAHLGGAWVANPTFEQIEQSTFEMVIAGRRNSDGEVDILMVEANATEVMFDLIAEGAPEIDEDIVVGGLEESKTYIEDVISLQEELVEAAGVREQRKEWVIAPPASEDVEGRLSEAAADRISEVLRITDKQEREIATEALQVEVVDAIASDLGDDRTKEITQAFRALVKKTIRTRIVSDGVRIDGRSPVDVRPISCEVGLLPRVHGSGLFNRGETQVLSVLALGMLKMEQFIGVDELMDRTKRYIHHYNFPPFSTGETGFMRGPRRRDIGHGALAEKAVLPVVPSDVDFPYAMRLVSEVLSSNGSTSMASVCASTLSLMDAGVPIRAPVAGIAMGLIKEGDDFVTLTDILGAEDAYGDMDFKVAGTENIVTALQLDTKISGVPASVLAGALHQAREARLHILGKMAEVLEAPRPELNPNAPRIIVIEIPVDKIGEVIGPKGKMINEITAQTGVEIDIEDDGTVRIGSPESGPAEEAKRMIEELAFPRIPEVGEVFTGEVVKITPFGAFVNLTAAKDGLLHISKLGGDIRLARVEDVLKEGEEIEVRVEDIDAMGKISLIPTSPPPRLAELPDDYEEKNRRDRGGRDRDRGGRGRRDGGRGEGRRRDGGSRGGRDRNRRPRRDSDD